MSKLIILGAGASKDYISETDLRKPTNWQPPVSKDILDKKFEGIISQYSPDIDGISSEFTAEIRSSELKDQSSDVDIEKYLSKVKALAQSHDFRQKQLTAFEFYLQHLFGKITEEFGGQTANNYSHLLNFIRTQEEKVYVVNFNYDLLFENSAGYTNLSQSQFNTHNYIKNDVPIIKIHGAFNWKIPINPPFESQREELIRLSSKPFLINNPHIARDVSNNGSIVISKSYLETFNGISYYLRPAMALPINEDKSKNFVCPQSHIDLLIKHVNSVDKILIIGWKATDEYLLKLLDENLRKPTLVTIVSGSEKGILQTQTRLKEKVNNIYFGSHVAKFSNFLTSEECREFFLD